MKIPDIHRKGWFWVSMACFGLLIALVSVELGLVYPQVKRYFGNTSSITSQPLASRARKHLLSSLELLYAAPESVANNSQIRNNLDMAYGLLNVNLYLSNYDCTTDALKRIDTLYETLYGQSAPDPREFSYTMLPTLQCVDLIEAGQDKKRSELALKIASMLDFHRRILPWGAVIMVACGIFFFLLHLRQRKLIAHNKDETRKWIHNALRDSLTGILNRRAFDDDLSHYVKKYQENANLFSLLICDIDFFKQYNDSLGHPEGDKALQHIARALSQMMRDRDKLYRYGGEELVLILDNTDKTQAQKVGQRALEQIRRLRLPHPKSESGHITISIGCATINETDSTGESLLTLADRRLYMAKQGGRNRMICSDA